MRARLLFALAVMVLAGCSGAPPPSVSRASPTLWPTAIPTSTPTPAPTLNKLELGLKLQGVCDGTPFAWAAPYAGDVHPLVVFDEFVVGISESFGVNSKWLYDGWPSPIQLVVCAHRGDDGSVVGMCGSYTGTDVFIREARETVRVVTANTGRTLQQTVLTRPVGECPESVFIYGPPSDPTSCSVVPIGSGRSCAFRRDADTFETEVVVTDEVTREQLDEYARAVLTQVVQ